MIGEEHDVCGPVWDIRAAESDSEQLHFKSSESATEIVSSGDVDEAILQLISFHLKQNHKLSTSVIVMNRIR